MTSPFSWSDTVKIAFISCLPCLKPDTDEHSEHEDQPHKSAINRIPRACPDELQGLLADDDTDMDAETLSLHSNPGRARRDKKQKRTKKHNNHRRITFFGYNLFGRPPVQLPDEDDALYGRINGDLTPNAIVTAHSTATFDSDAAPLDSDTIAALSSSNVAAAAQASADVETQSLKEKEERRQRRREKKEFKRLAQSMAAQGIVGDGDEFEGFQGSGAFKTPPLRKGYPHTINAIFPGSGSGSGSAFSGSAQEEYGRFVASQAPPILQPEDNLDDADLDGGVYAHKSRRSKGSHGGSDSRSRTSTSTSDRGRHQVSFNPTNVHAPSLQPQPGRNKTSSTTSATTNSLTTSQSPSLPSPISLAFSNEIVSPSTVEQGQGFFDAEDPVLPSIANDVQKPVGEFLTPRLRGEFPMTGFRGLTGVGANRTGDFGAFLARRGDEDDTNGL